MHFYINSIIQVRGEWLVYSNQLVLLRAVVPTSTGSVVVRGATTVVIPVECHYKRYRPRAGAMLDGSSLSSTLLWSRFIFM